MRVWDHAVPARCSAHTTFPGNGELLTCSWNRYQQYTVCTGGVDTAIRLVCTGGVDTAIRLVWSGYCH